MISDVEGRIIKSRNELKSLKVATELSYSSMLMPENAPTATYSGSINLNAMNDPMARVTATFTRSDESEITPYVDIMLDTDIFTYEDWVKSIGGTVSGRDVKWGQSGLFTVYVDNTTDKSVTFNIDVTQNVMQLSGVMSSVDFTIRATAISPVSGTLTLRRAI